MIKLVGAEIKKIERKDAKAIDESMRRAYTQEGGGKMVVYGDVRVIIPIVEVKYAISVMERTGDKFKQHALALASVNLAEVYKTLTEGDPTNEDVADFCKNLTIWYANEVMECRQYLEETVQ